MSSTSALHIPRSLALIMGALAGAGCGADLDPDAAQAAVEQAFKEANPPGRTGMELKGKNVWLEAPYFDEGCITGKHLAFPDDPHRRPKNTGPRISPTYASQRFLTAATEDGVCVYLGDTPTLTVDEVSWGGDRYRVHITVGMEKPTEWFNCLEDTEKKRMVEVTVREDGSTELLRNVDLYQGDCPAPLPGGEAREGTARPSTKAVSAPSEAEVVALAKAFDEALWNLDFSKARELTSCFNVFEEQPYGACAASEFLVLGPVPRGEVRPQDGTPWNEYVFADLDSMGRIVKDPVDGSVWHATFKHKRTGKTKSFGVQKVKGEWKMLGIVGRQAEGITTVRYMNDLHDKDKRAILERRLAGEEIDERGEPLNPEAEEAE